MNIIDAVVILIILLYIVLGLKRGVIRTGIGLIGTLAVLVLAFTFKDYLANLLMKHLPFFNFGGIFNGITSINILIYELISFIVIFVLLYCILNILLSLSGLVEKLLKVTVILAIPSKILGALLGFIEGVVMAFIVSFILLHIPTTESMVMDSEVAVVVLERTPIMGPVAAGTTLALEDINAVLEEAKDNPDREEANFKTLQILIYYQIIDSKDAQKLIDDKKLDFKNTIIV